MGCISSKAITRSLSIREEYFNPSFRSKSVAWEELLTSNGGDDQLLAFICSENGATNKRRTGSITLPPESLDLISDTKEKTEEVQSISDDFGDLDFSRFTRSKSYQISREKELFFEPDPNQTENKLDWNDKNMVGSRSFHTVEEYDELLERIHNSRTRSSFEDYRSSLDVKPQSNKQRNTTDSSKDEGGKKEDVDLGQDRYEDRERDRDRDQDQRSCSSGRNLENFEKIIQTGWKRKAVAKELKSLDVSAVEFPAVARIKQWIQVEGQVYSPGSYITPKFGSYNSNAPRRTGEDRGGGSSVFSPELVAAFEDCMQQLQEEEDSILNHMDEYQTEQPSDSKN